MFLSEFCFDCKRCYVFLHVDEEIESYVFLHVDEELIWISRILQKKIDVENHFRCRGKRISNDFERPEGAHKDVAELDVLRKCACS